MARRYYTTESLPGTTGRGRLFGPLDSATLRAAARGAAIAHAERRRIFREIVAGRRKARQGEKAGPK